MGGLMDLVDTVVSFVGRPFGIYTHDETFTDIQISTLLTPGEADKAARRSAIRNSGGSSQMYFDVYRNFQRQYKRRYSQKFLENVGYAPSSSATARAIDVNSVETHIETTEGYASVSIEDAIDLYLNLDKKAKYGRQFVTGYDIDTMSVTSAGKVYLYNSVEELSPTSINLKFLRDFNDSIEDNLTNNYSYDSGAGTVIINGELYSVGTFSSMLNGSDQYETVCTHIPEEVVDITVTASVGVYDATVTFPEDIDNDGYVQLDEVVGDLDIHIDLPIEAQIDDILIVTIDGNTTNYTVDQNMIDNGLDLQESTYNTGFEPQLPDETLYTSAERFSEVYNNALFDNEVTWVEYRVLSGEVSNALRYYLAAADTLNIYFFKTIDMTAIIPMKENNVVANENDKLRRMLRKLNLSHEQLLDSISNPDLDAAYIMTGINTAVDNDPHNEVLFRTFDLMFSGNGNTTISISQLNITYSFTIVKNTISGSIAPVGGYVRSGYGAGGITLRYQGSATEYQEIVVSNFNGRYAISGQVLNAAFNSPDNRIVIPLDIFNSLRYRYWVDIYENSLCMLGYAVETIEVKWYETAAFSFILQIVGFVLALPSGGTSLTLVEIAKAVLINVLITQVVMILAEAIGGELGALVAAAVAIYLSIEFGGLKDTSGQELWLKAADKGLSTITQAIAAETEEKMNEFNTQLDDLDAQIREIKEKAKEFEEDSVIYAHYSLPFSSVGKPNKVFQTIEEYVNSIVNTEWLVDGSWMYDIDGEIAVRNSVYVG